MKKLRQSHAKSKKIFRIRHHLLFIVIEKWMFFVQKKDSGGFKDSSTRIQVDSETRLF